ncbi:Uncharacterised protein [Vibrio cholerae]|nr:Uncharacterised protein [Vibrio cholerae]
MKEPKSGADSASSSTFVAAKRGSITLSVTYQPIATMMIEERPVK